MTIKTKAAVGDWATRALMVASLGVGGWAVGQVVDHNREIAVMQGNRFTSEDGLEVWQAIADLKAELLTEMPPRWLVDRLDRLENKVDALTEKVQEHEH